eukprot:COSAG02_NODE_6053_length_3840_cov_2.507618_4_plen_33_part_00
MSLQCGKGAAETAKSSQKILDTGTEIGKGTGS